MKSINLLTEGVEDIIRNSIYYVHPDMSDEEEHSIGYTVSMIKSKFKGSCYKIWVQTEHSIEQGYPDEYWILCHNRDIPETQLQKVAGFLVFDFYGSDVYDIYEIEPPIPKDQFITEYVKVKQL